MAIKKIKAQSPDPYLGKIKGDTEFARLAHLNQLVDQINNNTSASTYKVYTALLTQSGGDDVQSINSGDLTIGITYKINVADNDGDFTNVGAPNNNAGTYFVATGTTPNTWGTTGDLKYNNGAPTVTVLENTIGNIWFEYDNVGQYFVNSDGLFTTDKTFISIVAGSSSRPDVLVTYITNTTSNIILHSVRLDTPVNDLLLNASLEIRVYN